MSSVLLHYSSSYLSLKLELSWQPASPSDLRLLANSDGAVGVCCHVQMFTWTPEI